MGQQHDEPENLAGRLLRDLRIGLGRSQAEQADDLSQRSDVAITRHEVSRWERGKRLPSPFWQAHYASSLGAPVTDISDAVADTRARRQDAGHDVDRRQFVSVLAGLVLPTAADPAPRRVDMRGVKRLRRDTARLRRLDDLMGGGDTYPIYASTPEHTARLINASQHAEDVGRALRSLLAEQEQLAGWAAFDAGRHAQARRHYRTSLAAADEAGDDVLAGSALAFTAYQQSSNGQSGSATARASVERASSTATPRVAALLLERSAWAHAAAGDAREADVALGRAREALHRDDDRPEPDWVFWINDTEIDIMSGRCWTELRRPLRAVPVLENVLATFDDTCARDKALYTAWLVDAYLQANEVEQAAAALGRAFELASGVASARPSARIFELARRLEPHRGNADVAELLAVISSTA